MIRIDSYEKFQVDENLIFDFSLDIPKKEFDGTRQPFGFLGWIAGKNTIFEKIEITVNNRRKIEIPIDLHRPDVMQAFPESPCGQNMGFFEYLNPFLLPKKFDLVVSAVSREIGCVQLYHMTGERITRVPETDMAMKPLILTTLGRTGSTLLTAMLGFHPAVCVYRPFMAEARYASYWEKLFLLLGDPKSWMSPMAAFYRSNPEWVLGLGDKQLSHYGLYPEMFEWFADRYLPDLHRFTLESLQSHYKKIAAIENKCGAVYFCEKFLPDPETEHFLEFIPSTKEVFLVRDFRDMLVSILAFNKKRGYDAFGREKFDNVSDYIRLSLKPGAEMLAASWLERKNGAFLIKYEELISKPNDVLRDVYKYLGVDCSTQTIKKVIDGVNSNNPEKQREHMTSADQNKSLVRFKEELDPSLLSLCNEHFENPLKVFGYSL